MMVVYDETSGGGGVAGDAPGGLRRRILREPGVSPALSAAPASPAPASAAASAANAKPAASAQPSTAAASKPATTAKPAASGTRVTVRAGVLGIVPDAPIFIGVERGYYADQGITVDTTKFNTAGDMIAPLAAGQLDVGLGTPGAGLFNAITRDVPIRIVADNSRVAPGKSHLALLKRKDNTSLNDYADMKGKKISINAPAGGPEVELSRALAKGNLTFKDIDLKDVPFPDVNTALVNKSIDAGFQLEPFATLGIEGQDKAGVVQILAKDTAVKDPSLYDKMISHVIDPNAGVNMDALSYDLNYFVKNGSVKQAPDLKEVVDLSFVDAAVAKLGKVTP